jgi:hypothetical protein
MIKTTAIVPDMRERRHMTAMQDAFLSALTKWAVQRGGAGESITLPIGRVDSLELVNFIVALLKCTKHSTGIGRRRSKVA